VARNDGSKHSFDQSNGIIAVFEQFIELLARRVWASVQTIQPGRHIWSNSRWRRFADFRRWRERPLETASVARCKLKPFAGPIKDQSGAQKVAAGSELADQDIRTMIWLVEGVQGTLPKS